MYQRQQVEPRKRQVARADHERDQEVAQDRRNRRDQKEEDHDDAVHREQAVVGVGRLEDVSLRGHELEPHHGRGSAADEEEERDRRHEQEADPLVVGREEPRLQGVRLEIIFLELHRRRGRAHRVAPSLPMDLMYAMILRDRPR